MAVLFLLQVPHSFAVNPDEMLTDPVLERRARDISAGLRCLVCQNESIDDSNADLARDLRLLVRHQLSQGKSNDEVLQYLRDRYGNFIMLKPPLQANTLLLWLAPAVALGLAAGTFVYYIRRDKSDAGLPVALSDHELDQLKDLES